MKPLGRAAQPWSLEALPGLITPGLTSRCLKKHLVDDTDFHGLITPGDKFTSQRLDDECSTALPSQCTSAGSLESLPTTPAGFRLPITPAGLGRQAGHAHGWQPGVQTWRPGHFGGPGLHSDFPGCPLPSDQLELGVGPDFDDLAAYLLGSSGPQSFANFPCLEPTDFSDLQPVFEPSVSEPSVSEFSVSELEPSVCDQPSSSHCATRHTISPPSTPRQDSASHGTCPLAPAEMSYPPLMKALQKNNLDMVVTVLEADIESARFPFWDHNIEPPLCTAIRLGCSVDIVEHLIKSDADVKARDAADRSPLEVLYSTTWRSVESLNEIEEVLISAGAEPLENSGKVPHNEKGANGMFGLDCVINEGYSMNYPLYDFGLPPSLDFDDFALPPPPL